MARIISGFTVLDLAIAVAIIGLTAGIAIPGYHRSVSAAHASKSQAELHSSLALALTSSTVSNTDSVLCASSDGNSCSGSIDWTTGWIVFVDANGNRRRSMDEPLIANHGPLGGGVHLRSTVGRLYIVFQPHGGAAAGTNVTFTICDARGPAKAAALVLANTGRFRLGTPSPAAASACGQGL